MNEVVLFGEKDKEVVSSCDSCTGCGDKSEHLCTDVTPTITSEDLTLKLKKLIEANSLSDQISVEFKDINTDDLTDYKDVKTLINMSFAFPILTVNKKIKYMGPFDPNIVLKDIKETIGV